MEIFSNKYLFCVTAYNEKWFCKGIVGEIDKICLQLTQFRDIRRCITQVASIFSVLISYKRRQDLCFTIYVPRKKSLSCFTQLTMRPHSNSERANATHNWSRTDCWHRSTYTVHGHYQRLDISRRINFDKIQSPARSNRHSGE